jgi:hypothetical protein
MSGKAARAARLDHAQERAAVPARAVASALLAAMLDPKPGVRVLKSGEMQARNRP